MKILLTAFEPFNNIPTNSSLEVQKQIEDTDVIKVVLPVSYERSKTELIKAIEQHKPDFVLSLGQANGETKIRIEYVGLNYTRSSIPDNDGDLREKGKVFENDKEAYFTNAHVEELNTIVSLIAPSYVSTSAGSYVCNTVYYTALKTMRGNALFIHLPLFENQVKDAPGMELETMISAIKTTLDWLKKETI